MIWAAEEIKAFRKKHGLTQPMLAKLVGCDLRTVTAWEAGYFLPGAINQEALSNIAKERES